MHGVQDDVSPWRATFTFPHVVVLVRGAGDLASGAIYRLHRGGFPVVVTELPAPLAVRRAVAFAEAVYAKEVTIEGIVGCRVETANEVPDVLARGHVPVLVDPEARIREEVRFSVVVDGIMAKRNTGTRLTDARLVVALGPGFTAGVDAHAVVETARGHTLGRVYWSGTALPDTGIPGTVKGRAKERVLRAPCDGHVQPRVHIGDTVDEGQVVCTVEGEPVRAPFAGVLRGIIHPRVPVRKGMKIGDVDPRARPEHCFTISDKSLAVGGGVLEAVMSAPQIRPLLRISSRSVEHDRPRPL